MSLRQRKGSALLVVLGMVAFIVISAVAFSAYMRYSRAPSSFLRQTIASRMIVKAALAEAISEIDEAIGNNPHPGVGDSRQNYLYENVRGGITVAGTNNYWRGRVLIGVDRDHVLPDYEDTVSTLTYEGLAYIPPALVNEARYYSRRATTAQWRSLDFDVGRYAFCAIDVSDFFDVNIMTAAGARSSAANSRITLNYLFDGASQAEQWEELVDQFRDCDEDAGTISLANKVPLISVADMNLAMGKGSYGGLQSPFCQYDHQGERSFYDGIDLEDIQAMTFVTDGWFPPAKIGNDVYDLADSKYQPFSSAELNNQAPNYYEITESASLTSQRLLQYVPNIALAALYDYLDEDRVPLSLGIPTLERVPMVCGVEPTFDGTLQIEQMKNGAPAPGNEDEYEPKDHTELTTRTAKRKIVFKLKTDNFFGSMPQVKALVTYPFRHDDKVPSSGFTVDGGIAVFFTTGAMGLRPRNAVDRLRFTSESLFSSASGNGAIGNGVILLPFGQQSVSFSSINSQDSAVKEISLTADPSSAAAELAKDDYALLSITYEWTQNDTSDRANGQMPWSNVDKPEPTTDDIKEAFCGIKPLQDTGALEKIYDQKDSALVSAIESAGHTWTLNVAPFIRVKYENKTVDMVPACGENDNINGSSNWQLPESQILLQDYYGEASPLLRFDTGVSFAFNLAGLAAANSPQTETIAPKAIMVGDPRFNYAPESWFGYAAGGISPTVWMSENGAKDNDGDIFMQVSDQGYLQSAYELANITRFGTSGFGNFGDEEYGHMKNPKTFGVNNSFATGSNDKEHIANQHLMWRTYDPFGRYLAGGDKFDLLKLVNEGTGFKVNPYSDSTNIVMAALMNTPHDWRCASTNNIELGGVDVDQFNQNYAWNEESSSAKLSDLDCQKVAGELMERMRQGNVTNWKDEWDGMWRFDTGNGDNGVSTLCGFMLEGNSDEIYNSDKKFLYGYWRDCFATRQQLFLVFVRAEPCMMGGGATGITPPQLGARAVALVWRDPAENPNGANLPHKTRILFYRQFD